MSDSDLKEFLDWSRRFKSENGIEPTPGDAWLAAKDRRSLVGGVAANYPEQGVWPFGKNKPARGNLEDAAK